MACKYDLPHDPVQHRMTPPLWKCHRCHGMLCASCKQRCDELRDGKCESCSDKNKRNQFWPAPPDQVKRA